MLTCSRKNLLSVICHALIHCTVFETSQAASRRIYDHDVNFLEIMKFINEHLDLEIGTDHTFLRATDEKLESYQCRGGCSQNGYFAGIIKSSPQEDDVPPPIIAQSHSQVCNGNFHRILEISRTANNNLETLYVCHNNLEYPKVAEGAGIHQKTTTKPRELIDITDDDDIMADPKVIQMTQVIDLEEAEFADKKKAARKVVQMFKGHSPQIYEVCPLCGSSLDWLGGLSVHLNFCLGILINLPTYD